MKHIKDYGIDPQNVDFIQAQRFGYRYFVIILLANSKKGRIFALTVSATLPIEQRTRAELLLL